MAMVGERRFWSKVYKSDGCWLWTAGRNGNGYGQFYVLGRNVAAHRFAYFITYGPIAYGLELDHLCRVRHCVRPDHLEPVTNKQNVLRGISPAARHARQTHCKRGHLLAGANLVPSRRGRRTCRACHQLHSNRSYQRMCARKLAEATEGGEGHE